MIDSWRGPEALADSAALGFDGILSNGFYIDLCYPASDHYVVDPIPSSILAHGGAAGARPRRRGDHVGGVGYARDDRLAHLAPHGRDCGATLVAGRHQ